MLSVYEYVDPRSGKTYIKKYERKVVKGETKETRGRKKDPTTELKKEAEKYLKKLNEEQLQIVMEILKEATITENY